MRAKVAGLVALVVAANLLAACGGGGSSTATTTTISTKPANRQAEACQLRAATRLRHPGVLTVATATPAYEPWFVDNNPSNGLGFEGGFTYDLAAKLGFSSTKVRWMALPFPAILAAGRRPFDLAISEIPGDAEHASSTKFSRRYWGNPEALVVMRGAKLASLPWASTATEQQAKGPLASAQLGVVAGSSAARFVRDTIQPKVSAKRFSDLNAAGKALRQGKLDGVVAALPDAWLLARNTKGARLLGSFLGSSQGFVVAVASKGVPLACVNEALGDLAAEGSTTRLARRYLSVYQR